MRCNKKYSAYHFHTSLQSYLPWVITDLFCSTAQFTFQVVNSTAVNITWNSNCSSPTRLHYSSYFTATGSVMSCHQLVLPPVETSAVIQLNDLPGYGHNFSLLLVGQTAPAITESFEFGSFIMPFYAFTLCSYFSQTSSTFRFNLDLLTTA